MSLLEAMSRGWHGDRFAYVVPEPMNTNTIPSRLEIEGVGTLRLEHTRLGNDGKPYRYVDEVDRAPMALRAAAPAAGPVPTAPEQAPAPVMPPAQAANIGYWPVLLTGMGASLLTAGLIGATLVTTPPAIAACALAIALGVVLILFGITAATPVEMAPVALEAGGRRARAPMHY